MKWPFVRRSKYELLEDELNIVKDGHDRILKHNKELSDENDSCCQEINRLNQELANELNSHRETNDLWHKSQEHADRFLDQIRLLEKEFEETKDALKIAQEDNEKIKKLNDKWWKAIKKFVLEINVSKTDCW